ncbi:hypothetical protein ACIHJG_39015 [Streptomyces sp. NPDC052415]|uniref:hypothetical protein n=1 Tax=Streptomyces sp. NPDC052415 TaxID=3365690 RepID=UPI0037CCF45A
MEQPLPETLRRLRAHNAERHLNYQSLSARTALPEETVQALLRGEDVPAGTVEERVCTRLKTLADAYLVRTGKRLPDLISEVHVALDISKEWARRLLKGERLPNVPLLHGLVAFFGVEGEEAFFTAPPADALNRVLQPILAKYESPETDPLNALMAKYGVVSTDLRRHGSMDVEDLERLLAGVIRSVVRPSEEGTEQ